MDKILKLLCLWNTVQVMPLTVEPKTALNKLIQTGKIETQR
jgi:hypothetical protein